MPLPQVREGEPSKVFLARCISSEIMRKEFPNDAQRKAVCYSQLRKARGKKTLSKKK